MLRHKKNLTPVHNRHQSSYNQLVPSRRSFLFFHSSHHCPAVPQPKQRNCRIMCCCRHHKPKSFPRRHRLFQAKTELVKKFVCSLNSLFDNQTLYSLNIRSLILVVVVLEELSPVPYSQSRTTRRPNSP